MTDEYVLFVAPSELQLSVYNSILQPSLAQSLIRGTGAGMQGLAMSESWLIIQCRANVIVDLLRKVSNTPLVCLYIRMTSGADEQLLRKKDDEGNKSREILDATDAALEVIPSDINMRDASVSGMPAAQLGLKSWES